MTDIIVHSLATIKHLNIRKEGPDKEKVLALDIKLADCNCSMDTLARILGANSWTDVRTAFWDADGEPRFLGLEPISSWSNIRGCTVEMLGITMRGAQVRKFKVRINGQESAEMELSVSVTSPPEKATPILAEYVMESVTVKITVEQGELDLEPADEPDFDLETGEITDIVIPPNCGDLLEGGEA